MNPSYTQLRDAAAMMIGRDDAEILITKVEDNAIKTFKASKEYVELLEAGKWAIGAMQNMRQGRFRGATARLEEALKALDNV